jgi:hypothetical protein
MGTICRRRSGAGAYRCAIAATRQARAILTKAEVNFHMMRGERHASAVRGRSAEAR